MIIGRTFYKWGPDLAIIKIMQKLCYNFLLWTTTAPHRRKYDWVSRGVRGLTRPWPPTARACLFLLAQLTSSITIGTQTETYKIKISIAGRQGQCLHYSGELATSTNQSRLRLQNELYFHNDYNVALCSCQEKAHPSEDCEQPKTTLLSHPCYSSHSLQL